MKAVMCLLLSSIIAFAGTAVDTAYSYLRIVGDTAAMGVDYINLSRSEEKNSKKEILDSIGQANSEISHPFILATDKDFQKIRDNRESDAYIKSLADYVIEYADSLLDTNENPPLEYELPDGERLLEISREVLDREIVLGAAWQITGEEKYAARAWLELEKVCSYDDWHTAHFLDAAEMALAVSIGYDWLFDYLTEEQKTLLSEKTWEYAIEPAMSWNHLTNWWVWSKTNWNSVCYGGIGIACMAFSDRNPEKAARFLKMAYRNMPIGFEVFTPDGVYVEGAGYWEYGTSYAVYFISTSKNYFGTDFGLSDIDGFSQLGAYPVYITLPTAVFNYGDNKSQPLFSPVLHWFSSEYGDPLPALYQMTATVGGQIEFIGEHETARESALSALWFDTANSDKSINTDNIDTCVLLKSDSCVDLAVMRSAYLDENATAAAVKSGYNYTNHGDLDIGTFVFDAGGVRWAEELGPGNYNAPGYFLGIVGGGRWNNYRKRAEGSNTLVINPDMAGEDQYPFAKSRITDFKNTDGGAVATVDMTDAYLRNAVKSAVRTVELFDSFSSLRISDSVQMKKESELYWFMHTKALIEIAADGKSAVLTIGEKQMLATLTSDCDAVFSVMSAEPIENDPEYTYNQENEGISKLAVHLQGVESVEMTVTLTPLNF